MNRRFFMNALLETVFSNRNYTIDKLRDMDSCPYTYPLHTDDLCKYLSDYHDNHKRLVLLCDFDLDGIMCGVLGYAGLCEMGFCVSLYYPDVSDGYGFSEKAIDRILECYPDVCGILTADVGITAYAGIKYAREKNLDVFVTDHHLPSKSVNQVQANVIVDPQCKEDTQCYSYICGAHVLYQVLYYYAKHYVPELHMSYYMQQIERLRVFAGFGTISDGMPLFHENRPLVRDMLSICRLIYNDCDRTVCDFIPGCQPYKRAFYGLFLVFQVFQMKGKLPSVSKLDESFIGYYVAPMFNSIKRMEGNISIAYDVFFGSENVGLTAVNDLFMLNETRKANVDAAYEQMKNSVQPWKPYVFVTDAGKGLCGLLAQRQMMETGLPCVVIQKESLSGSGRSPVWFPMLSETTVVDFHPRSDGLSDWFFAGHESAFGAGFEDESSIDSFVQFLDKRIPELQPVDYLEPFKPDYVIGTLDSCDFPLDIDLFSDFLHELTIYGPFGSGFDEPVGFLQFHISDGKWRTLSDNKHLKIMLPSGFPVMCWNQGSLLKDLHVKENGSAVVIVRGKLDFNVWNGVSSVQFVGTVESVKNDLKGDLLKSKG